MRIKYTKWLDTFYLLNPIKAIKLDHRLKYYSKSETCLQDMNFDLGAAGFYNPTSFTDKVIHCFTMIFSTNVIRLQEILEKARTLHIINGKKETEALIRYSTKVVALIYRNIVDIKNDSNFIMEDQLKLFELEKSLLKKEIFKVFENVIEHVEDKEAYQKPTETAEWLIEEFIKAQDVCGIEIQQSDAIDVMEIVKDQDNIDIENEVSSYESLSENSEERAMG